MQQRLWRCAVVGEGRQSGVAVYLLQVSRLLAQLSLPVRQARNVLEGGG